MLLLFSHSVVSDSCDPMDCRPPSSSDHGSFQAEYWSGLPFPFPGDLPDPGIEAIPLASPALAGGFFTIHATWEAQLKTKGFLKLENANTKEQYGFK